MVFKSFIESARPVMLIVAGTCLTCKVDLPTGTIFSVVEVVSETHRRRIEHPFSEEILAAAPHGQWVFPGVSFTTDTFVETSEQRQRLSECFPDADIIQMEDSHLVDLAKAAGIPTIILRGVTDAGSFSDHIDNLPEVVSSVVTLVRRFLRVLRQQRDLKLVANPTTRHLAFRLTVRTVGRSLPLPLAVSLATKALSWFGVSRILPEGSRVDLVFCPIGRLGSFGGAPSGSAVSIEKADSW